MNTKADQKSRRMEIRGLVKIAGDAVARFWPLRTFIHHNPLVSLESIPFHEAVRLACRRAGARGYLPCKVYRGYLAVGRIQCSHLDNALAAVARDADVWVGEGRVSHLEVLRAVLVDGFGCPEGDDVVVDDADIDALCSRLGVVGEVSQTDRNMAEVLEDQAALARDITLSQWCDQALGTRIVQQVNDELIKWCAAFLDEGHAVWAMPGRQRGFYRAWRALSAYEWSPCGILDSRRKIASLPDQPEDCLRDSLSGMGVPYPRWADYLAAELAVLPGWAGFIRWRAEQVEYPWQKAFPMSLVEYLAVRLWYERELVSQACRTHLGIEATFEGLSTYMHCRSYEYVSGKARAAGRRCSEEIDRATLTRRETAHRLVRLARALNIEPAILRQAEPGSLAKLVQWLDGFAEPHHGPIWLEAFEASYQDELVGTLARTVGPGVPAGSMDLVRPQSQSIYCIDVRMEPFRRHLETLGNHETFAFAGFFGAPIRLRPWGTHRETEQCPAVTKPRNEVREIPRSYHDHVVATHRSRAGILYTVRALVHDLRENVATPFVMVESLGWFYGMLLVGKTLWPGAFARLISWCREFWVPRVATSLTVDKLSAADIDEMIMAEQRAVVWKTLRAHRDTVSSHITPSIVEAVRQQAIQGDTALNGELVAHGRKLGLTREVLAGIVDELRQRRGLDERSVSHQQESLSRTGFTLDEQATTVETLLRMIGVSSNVARLVLICAHASTSTNNPYEAALDCGACGGNAGMPNARLVAMMANNPQVRDRVRARGIVIPSDTHFVAGQLDTTTDRVELFDLEDVPATHRRDVARLKEDLHEAGRLTSQERYGRLPDGRARARLSLVADRVQTRSTDWSQVLPEWGLSGNAAFIVGPRRFTRGLNLSGRVFMHSYDWRLDPGGRWLEVILTGPQLVCEWIALEHYFSTVDNEVYGSGSKAYHNVVGRLGVMSGPWSDLRVGLPRQTVISGTTAFHEPMRLLTVVVSPRERLDELIARHELLRHYYCNEWVHLAVVDEGRFYRFRSVNGWTPISSTLSSHRVGAAEERERVEWNA